MKFDQIFFQWFLSLIPTEKSPKVEKNLETKNFLDKLNFVHSSIFIILMQIKKH